MSEAPIKATLKAGRDFNAPWVTVDGDNPADLKFKLDALVAEGVFESVVNAANTLQAVNNVAPIAADVASPPNTGYATPQAAPQQPVQQPGGWNTSPSEVVPTWAAQSAQPQQAPAAPQQQGIRLHPEGIKCPADGNVVQFKEINSKKTGKAYQMWTCPNQRSRGDGHYSEFAN